MAVEKGLQDVTTWKSERPFSAGRLGFKPRRENPPNSNKGGK